MRRIIVIICFTLLLSPMLNAEIGSKGLIIENGAERLELEKGEKTRLSVRDGWTKRIVRKNLTFVSDNPAVAHVEKHSGILHANAMGNTAVSVIDKDGNAGTIQIIVSAQNAKPSPLLFLFILFAIGFIFIKIK